MSDVKAKGPVDLSCFDYEKKKHEEGISVAIKDPLGNDTGFSIRIAGEYSERAQKARRELSDELIAGGKLGALSADEVADRNIRYLAKITLGWTPNAVVEGKELEFSEANAVKVYRRYPSIREQVDTEAGKRERFIKG